MAKKGTTKRKMVDRFNQLFGTHHGSGECTPDPHDPVPFEVPAGLKEPPSIQEQIAQAVHEQLERTKDEEWDSPEEADDFEEEDPEILDFSPYEQHLIDMEYEPDMPGIVEEPPQDTPPADEPPPDDVPRQEQDDSKSAD